MMEWEDNGKRFFNCWHGFKYGSGLNIADCNDNQIIQLYDSWQMFIRGIICGQSEEIYHYVCKWIAHILRQTGEKPGTALCISGESGSGKGVFVSLLQEIVGQENFYMVSDKQELSTQYSDSMVERLIVNFDDFEWTNVIDGRIKGFIVNERQNIRRFLRSSVTISSYTRYIFTGIPEHILKIPKGDKRYVICNVSNARRWDKQYFKPLAGSLRSIAPYMTFFFKNIDINDWTPYPFSPVADYVERKKLPLNSRQVYLKNVLLGKIKGVYFWDNHGNSYNGAIDSTRWVNPDGKGIEVEEFERELGAVWFKAFPSTECLFARIKDLTASMKRNKGRRYGHVGVRLSNMLKYLIGNRNVKVVWVYGFSPYVRDFWFVVKKEVIERWLMIN